MAVLLVCATFPLIWVGGLVTTTQAGMAVPDWPSTYGYNLFLYPISTWLLGPWDLFIEHGHRLLGAVVGMMTIGVALSVWRNDERSWVRVYGLLAVGAVVGQGVLGGMRVLLDERILAKIHGCTGPAFFAMAVALAVVTSRWWRDTYPASSESAGFATAGGRNARLAMLTTMLAFVQLVLGAQVRHIAVSATWQQFQIAVYFHLIMAAILTVQTIVLLVSLVRDKHRRQAAIMRPALWLGGLLALQIILGAATWVAKYGWPGTLADRAWTADYTITAGSMLQAITITAHVATGSLILVNSLVLALRLSRLQAAATGTEALATGTNRNEHSHTSVYTLVGTWPVGHWQAEVAR